MKKNKGQMKKVAEFYADIYYCMTCGRTDLPLQLSHQINRSQGGQDTIENVIKECISCHLGVKHGWNIKTYLGRKI